MLIAKLVASHIPDEPNILDRLLSNAVLEEKERPRAARGDMDDMVRYFSPLMIGAMGDAQIQPGELPVNSAVDRMNAMATKIAAKVAIRLNRERFRAAKTPQQKSDLIAFTLLDSVLAERAKAGR
jgi:hypothetical protein